MGTFGDPSLGTYISCFHGPQVEKSKEGGTLREPQDGTVKQGSEGKRIEVPQWIDNLRAEVGDIYWIREAPMVVELSKDTGDKKQRYTSY